MRLIDADALKGKLDELEPYIDCDEDSTTWILSDEVYNAIDNTPTEPQVTVCCENASKEELEIFKKHLEYVLKRQSGEWIKKVDSAGFVSYNCSKCGFELELEDCSDSYYCTHCGAKMKKGGVE